MVQAKHPQLHDHILQHPALYRARGHVHSYRPCGAVATTGVSQDFATKARVPLCTISSTEAPYRKSPQEVVGEL